MRRIATVAAAVVSLSIGVAGAGPGDDGTHHEEGQYGGVNPTGTPSPDAKLTRPPAHTLGWIGFAANDGAGEVFFQAAQPFQLTQRVEGGAVIVTLDGLTKLTRNVRRPLDTRFFDAPIDRITAKAGRRRAPARAPAPAGVEVRIAFRAGTPVSEGVVRTATEKDGLYHAYLRRSLRPRRRRASGQRRLSRARGRGRLASWGGGSIPTSPLSVFRSSTGRRAGRLASWGSSAGHDPRRGGGSATSP
ncbi:MAG: hypothetical protein IPH80_29885 [Myxococcales bacterium]|nr:hypothetical protein [Myxococcales bacterium]